MPRLLLNLFFSLLLLPVAPAVADSWAPATEETVMSADKLVRVTIIPRPLDGALAYFKDKVDGRQAAGQRKGSEQKSPIGRLERKGSEGRWELVWQRPLINDVSPVSELVANGGRYLVTFDNWHSMGYGDDVVVIYDSKGEVIRKMALKDFLPEMYIAALPRSVSSIWWGRDHALADDGQTLVLKVTEPGDETGSGEPNTVDLRINLANGQVLPAQGEGWNKALVIAARMDKERQARWQSLRRLRAAPLNVPASRDGKAWREYMVELRSRLDETSGKRYAGMVYSPTPDRAYGDDAESILSLLEEFEADSDYSTRYFLLVSASSEALCRLLVTHLNSLKPNEMAGAHIAFAGTLEQGERLKAAARKSGAEVTLIDVSYAVPGMTLPEQPPVWFRYADH